MEHKKKAPFIASIILVISIFCISTSSYSQVSDTTAVKKEAMDFLNTIKEMKDEYNKLKSDDNVPRRIKERKLGEINYFIAEYISFCETAGLEPDESISSDVSLSSTKEEGSQSTSEEMAAVTPVNQVKSSEKDEITLTVTSDGQTKDDAIKNALRTAIEQAYGAFVSANTTIFNDELVKDEIVTVSNGSIKEYKEIASAQIENGSYSVTLSATVSLPHLITYAKNHGSECEFAGNTFGMEMKLFKIQKENELKALYNSIPVVEAMIRNSLTWNMEIEEPRIADNILQDVIYAIEKGEYEGFNKYYYDGDYAGLNYLLYGDSSHPERKENLNHELFEMIAPLAKGENIAITFKIGCVYDYNNVKQYIQNLLGGLSLSYDEYQNYNSKGFNPGRFAYTGLKGFVKVPYKEDVRYLDYIGWWLRNSSEDLYRWYDILKLSVLQIKNDFKIIDNTGQESYFNPTYFALLPTAEINYGELTTVYIGDLSISRHDNTKESWTKCLDFFNNNFVGNKDHWGSSSGSFLGLKKYAYGGSDDYLGIGGSGLFSKLFMISDVKFEDINRNSVRTLVDLHCDWNNPRTDPDEPMLPWKITVFLPASEVERYSHFKVTTANTPQLDIPFNDLVWK